MFSDTLLFGAHTKESLKISKTSYPLIKKSVRPTVIVKVNGERLTKGKDYVVVYRDNKKVGTASIIVKGKGDYTGTAVLRFNIVSSI